MKKILSIILVVIIAVSLSVGAMASSQEVQTVEHSR